MVTPINDKLEDDNELLKEILLRFEIDALKGLIELYLCDSFAMQFIAIECILTIYKQYKEIINDDMKKKIKTLFKTKFKPYYTYKSIGLTIGKEEYKELLIKFKKEYSELKNKY